MLWIYHWLFKIMATTWSCPVIVWPTSLTCLWRAWTIKPRLHFSIASGSENLRMTRAVVNWQVSEKFEINNRHSNFTFHFRKNVWRKAKAWPRRWGKIWKTHCSEFFKNYYFWHQLNYRSVLKKSKKLQLSLSRSRRLQKRRKLKREPQHPRPKNRLHEERRLRISRISCKCNNVFRG